MAALPKISRITVETMGDEETKAVAARLAVNVDQLGYTPQHAQQDLASWAMQAVSRKQKQERDQLIK